MKTIGAIIYCEQQDAAHLGSHSVEFQSSTVQAVTSADSELIITRVNPSYGFQEDSDRCDVAFNVPSPTIITSKSVVVECGEFTAANIDTSSIASSIGYKAEAEVSDPWLTMMSVSPQVSTKSTAEAAINNLLSNSVNMLYGYQAEINLTESDSQALPPSIMFTGSAITESPSAQYGMHTTPAYLSLGYELEADTTSPIVVPSKASMQQGFAIHADTATSEVDVLDIAEKITKNIQVAVVGATIEASNVSMHVSYGCTVESYSSDGILRAGYAESTAGAETPVSLISASANPNPIQIELGSSIDVPIAECNTTSLSPTCIFGTSVEIQPGVSFCEMAAEDFAFSQGTAQDISRSSGYLRTEDAFISSSASVMINASQLSITPSHLSFSVEPVMLASTQEMVLEQNPLNWSLGQALDLPGLPTNITSYPPNVSQGTAICVEYTAGLNLEAGNLEHSISKHANAGSLALSINPGFLELSHGYHLDSSQAKADSSALPPSVSTHASSQTHVGPLNAELTSQLINCSAGMTPDVSTSEAALKAHNILANYSIEKEAQFSNLHIQSLDAFMSIGINKDLGTTKLALKSTNIKQSVGYTIEADVSTSSAEAVVVDCECGNTVHPVRIAHIFRTNEITWDTGTANTSTTAQSLADTPTPGINYGVSISADYMDSALGSSLISISSGIEQDVMPTTLCVRTNQIDIAQSIILSPEVATASSQALNTTYYAQYHLHAEPNTIDAALTAQNIDIGHSDLIDIESSTTYGNTHIPRLEIQYKVNDTENHILNTNDIALRVGQTIHVDTASSVVELHSPDLVIEMHVINACEAHSEALITDKALAQSLYVSKIARAYMRSAPSKLSIEMRVDSPAYSLASSLPTKAQKSNEMIATYKLWTGGYAHPAEANVSKTPVGFSYTISPATAESNAKLLEPSLKCSWTTYPELIESNAKALDVALEISVKPESPAQAYSDGADPTYSNNCILYVPSAEVQVNDGDPGLSNYRFAKETPDSLATTYDPGFVIEMHVAEITEVVAPEVQHSLMCDCKRSISKAGSYSKALEPTLVIEMHTAEVYGASMDTFGPDDLAIEMHIADMGGALVDGLAPYQQKNNRIVAKYKPWVGRHSPAIETEIVSPAPSLHYSVEVYPAEAHISTIDVEFSSSYTNYVDDGKQASGSSLLPELQIEMHVHKELGALAEGQPAGMSLTTPVKEINGATAESLYPLYVTGVQIEVTTAYAVTDAVPSHLSLEYTPDTPDAYIEAIMPVLSVEMYVDGVFGAAGQMLQPSIHGSATIKPDDAEVTVNEEHHSYKNSCIFYLKPSVTDVDGLPPHAGLAPTMNLGDDVIALADAKSIDGSVHGNVVIKPYTININVEAHASQAIMEYPVYPLVAEADINVLMPDIDNSRGLEVKIWHDLYEQEEWLTIIPLVWDGVKWSKVGHDYYTEDIISIGFLEPVYDEFGKLIGHLIKE